MSKRLLVVCSHCVGETTMVSVRLKRLLNYLSRYGWEVDCICYGATPSKDATPSGIHLFSFPNFGGRGNILDKLLRKLIFPIYVLIIGSARVIRRHIPTTICFIPDVEAFVGGVMLKTIFRQRMQLILEVQDPFSMNAAYPWPSWKRSLFSRLEAMLVRFPDKMIFLTQGICDMYLVSFDTLQARWKKQFSVITDGFDPEEFGQPCARSPVSYNTPLVISHIGNFYDRRQPNRFLETLRTHALTHGIPACKVHFLGDIYGTKIKKLFQELLRTPELRQIVVWFGNVSHPQAITHMKNSDVNLVITHEMGSEYALPGKLFEYMGAGRPVLALTNDPLLIKVMEETRLGWVCKDEKELLAWFSTYLSSPQQARSHLVNSRAIERYRIDRVFGEWEAFISNRV